MATTTTNYGFILPAVGSPTDEDLWGDELNDNTTSLDSLLFTATNNVTRAESTSPVSTSVTDRNKVILVDATAGAITVNLLAAATAASGFTITIKKTDSSTNAVTIDGNSGETIDGSATYVLSTQNNAVVLTTNGSNWFTTAAPAPQVSPKGQQLITSGAGNFTTPSTTISTTRFKFTLTGGGGAGGGSSNGAGSGGGAGTTAIYYATGLSASQSCAYSIGAGGAGGSGNGADGTASTLTVGATTITAPPGTGGDSATNGAGAFIGSSAGEGGGAATNATMSIEGGGGFCGAYQGNAGFGGPGGASYWGGGARAGITNDGEDGKAWGSGGGGGHTTGTGGDGKSGVLLVEWD
jgi:hypothetical protein